MKEFYKLVALASPEAGAGRSVCAANIAIGLARRARCLALDLDVESRSLQTYFGLPSSRLGIVEFLEEDITSLNTIRARTSIANLDCIGWATSTENSFRFGDRGIDRLLEGLLSCKAAYVIAALSRGADDDTVKLFTAADFPVVVTHPSPEALKKVVEFLSRCKSERFEGRTIHLLVNCVQGGTEAKDAEAALKAAGHQLGLNVSILGAIPYDPQLLASFRPGLRYSPHHSPGVSASAFEDIASRIEPLPAQLPQDTAPPEAGTTLEPIQQTEETIRRLQGEHRAAVEELRAELKRKDAQLAESAAVIRTLEADLMLRNPESSRRIERMDRLELSIPVRQADTEAARENMVVMAPVAGKPATKKTSYLVPVAAAGLVALAILSAILILGRHEEPQPVRAPQINTAPQQAQADVTPADPAAASLPEREPAPAPVAAAPIPAPKPAAAPKPAREQTPAKTISRSQINSSVVQQVLPEIPKKVRRTIKGRVRTRVKVSTDASGSVTQATLDSPGPSQYFADLALEAARKWKFTPTPVDGQNVPGEWVLRFDFDKNTTNVAVIPAAP